MVKPIDHLACTVIKTEYVECGRACHGDAVYEKVAVCSDEYFGAFVHKCGNFHMRLKRGYFLAKVNGIIAKAKATAESVCGVSLCRKKSFGLSLDQNSLS